MYDATGTVSTHGLEGSDVSFSISGMSDEGVIAGTYGSITLNSETGAYTYTANNTLAENQGLQNGEENIDFFKVAGTDGTNNNTTFLSFTISGVTEPLGLTPPTNDALVEGADANTAEGSLATGAEGLVDGESTATYGIEGVTASDGAAVKSGTYGSLSVNTATGAYTYTLDSNAADGGNATLRALSGADLVSDDFVVTLDDGLGGEASATISFPVQGYGIKIDDVASDNVINKAEADEGITITGTTNPNQEITLAFNSETDLAGGTNVATSDADGNWSIDVTAADVAGMGEGAETLTASMTLQETVNVVVTRNSYNEMLFDGEAVSAFTMQEGYTYIFDQSDTSNTGRILKLAGSVGNEGDDEFSDAESVYTITGTPGSANANTTVKLATDLATSGTTELYFYWEVDGSPMSGYGSGTFALRLSS